MDKDTETVLTLTNFPRLGCPDFCWPPAKPSPDGNVSQSIFFPDECINPHPRFPNLTRNIRQRRGKKVKFLFPILHELKKGIKFLFPFLHELNKQVTFLLPSSHELDKKVTFLFSFLRELNKKVTFLFPFSYQLNKKVIFCFLSCMN